MKCWKTFGLQLHKVMVCVSQSSSIFVNATHIIKVYPKLPPSSQAAFTASFSHIILLHSISKVLSPLSIAKSY